MFSESVIKYYYYYYYTFRPNSSRKLKMAAIKTLCDHLIVPINAIQKLSIILHNMTTYVSSSYGLSSVMFSYILAQMPRHSPQPVEQSNSALRQEQLRVSHPILQLHRTTFSSAFGATSMSHCSRSSLPYTAFSQDSVDADVDQTLIPPSIFAPGVKYGGYGTWQLMASEEGFQAAQNVYWWLYLLMKTLQPQFI